MDGPQRGNLVNLNGKLSTIHASQEFFTYIIFALYDDFRYEAKWIKVRKEEMETGGFRNGRLKYLQWHVTHRRA